MPIPGHPEPPGSLPDPPPVPVPPVPIEEPTPDHHPQSRRNPIRRSPWARRYLGLMCLNRPFPSLAQSRVHATFWAAAEVGHAAVLRRLSRARLS